MKFLFASDSFKGSLTSEQTIQLLTKAATEPLPPKGGRFNQRLKPPKVDRIPARRYLLFSQQFFLSTQVSIFCYLHNVIFMSYVQYDDFL